MASGGGGNEGGSSWWGSLVKTAKEKVKLFYLILFSNKFNFRLK
jgi:hypothetical protein